MEDIIMMPRSGRKHQQFTKLPPKKRRVKMTVSCWKLLSSHCPYPPKKKRSENESHSACCNKNFEVWHYLLTSNVHVFFFKPRSCTKKNKITHLSPRGLRDFSPYSRGMALHTRNTLSLVSPNSIHFTATKPRGDRASGLGPHSFHGRKQVGNWGCNPTSRS